MPSTTPIFERLYQLFLSDTTRKHSEVAIIRVAIASFMVHLAIILMSTQGWFGLSIESSLFTNPISAIYTPFSFILIYEVYLLVYYLPKSISRYIGKQYEIITLILIRRIYYDLANLEFVESWFSSKNDLQFTYDIIGTLLLFVLILVFYRLNISRGITFDENNLPPSVERFINIKKGIATVLVPLFIILAITNFYDWISTYFVAGSIEMATIKELNKIFYDDFFTVLIMVDVFLLLISFMHTDEFSTVIRNSGYIISTILIKLSFGIDGLLNTILTVAAVLFGVIILAIHIQYERRINLAPESSVLSQSSNP